MARLTTTGTISIDDVRNTFSLTGTRALSTLYRNGGIVADTPQHAAVPTSGTISLSNLYGADILSYSLTPGSTTLDEGGSNDGANPSTQAFSINCTGFSADTTGTLYWTVDGTTADFNAVSGSVAVANNAGSFSITVKDDNVTEGTENFTVSLREGSISGTVVATSSVEVLDTSVAANYGMTGPAAINEGSTGTYSITSSGVADGTTVYWTIDGATTADFNAVSGTATITSDAGSFGITPKADTLTEGAETYTVSLRSGSITGAVLASVANVVINDTSISAPTYSLTGPTTIAEDDAANTYSVATTNVADGTVLYWTVNGTTADFTAVSGSFSVTSNSGSFNLTAIADVTTEGSENYVISLRETSTSGTVVDTLSITVTDDSLAPAFSIATPSITTPLNNAIDIAIDAAIVASAYTPQNGAGTHASTDWEIYSDAGLTTLVESSLNDTTNLTNYTPTGLAGGTQYWARVRYRSSDPVVSAYSTAVTWTTAAAGLLSTTMTIGTATSEFSWLSATTQGVHTFSGGVTHSLSGYDGGDNARYDDWLRVQGGGFTSSFEQTPDNFGSMGSTDVGGRTLLYLYVASSNPLSTGIDQLYLGFIGTGTVSFTSITINGNTLNQSDATTDTYGGNRYYLWDNQSDGIEYPGLLGNAGYPIPASGTINVTIT